MLTESRARGREAGRGWWMVAEFLDVFGSFWAAWELASSDRDVFGISGLPRCLPSGDLNAINPS